MAENEEERWVTVKFRVPSRQIRAEEPVGKAIQNLFFQVNQHGVHGSWAEEHKVIPQQGPRCCCSWGAAVRGEYPEFGCADCPVHQGGLGETERCKQHTKEKAR